MDIEQPYRHEHSRAEMPPPEFLQVLRGDAFVILMFAIIGDDPYRRSKNDDNEKNVNNYFPGCHRIIGLSLQI